MFYRILRENTNTPAMTCHGAEKIDLETQHTFSMKLDNSLENIYYYLQQRISLSQRMEK